MSNRYRRPLTVGVCLRRWAEHTDTRETLLRLRGYSGEIAHKLPDASRQVNGGHTHVKPPSSDYHPRSTIYPHSA